MAIKIIKEGQKEFHGFCKWCGCEFTYEISDLKLSATSDKLDCPTCGKTYYHPSMVQDPTIPGGIGYQWQTIQDMNLCETIKDPCAGCAWRAELLAKGSYIGDTPCDFCNKNPYKVTCLQTSVTSADYPKAVFGKTEGYNTTSDHTEGVGLCNSATCSCCGDAETQGKHKKCKGGCK